MDRNIDDVKHDVAVNLEIYIDFKNDLTLIAHRINDLIIYSIQNEEVLQSNVKNIVFFNELLENGNWKRFTHF
jgi:hypothetical protein